MKEDFARMKCPACGAETFIRINKNRILYTYCPMGHHLKLTAQESRQAIPVLTGGKPWNNGILFLYPLMKGNQGNGTSKDERVEIGRRGNDACTTTQRDGSARTNGANTADWWNV